MVCPRPEFETDGDPRTDADDDRTFFFSFFPRPPGSPPPRPLLSVRTTAGLRDDDRDGTPER